MKVVVFVAERERVIKEGDWVLSPFQQLNRSIKFDRAGKSIGKIGTPYRCVVIEEEDK